MVKDSIKFKVEYVGGGAATFGKRELLKMMPVHLMQQLAESQMQQLAEPQMQQLAEPQMQQPAESAVKVRSICKHGRQRNQCQECGSEEAVGGRIYLSIHGRQSGRTMPGARVMLAANTEVR